MLSFVVVRASSSLMRAYCDKTDEVRINGFSLQKVVKYLNFRMVSLTTKFEGDPLERGLKLWWGGFRLQRAMSQRWVIDTALGHNYSPIGRRWPQMTLNVNLMPFTSLLFDSRVYCGKTAEFKNHAVFARSIAMRRLIFFAWQVWQGNLQRFPLVVVSK